jgi:hypothetical protein
MITIRCTSGSAPRLGALLLGTLICAAPLRAQSHGRAPEREAGGLRTMVALGYLKPRLGGDSERVFRGAGRFSGAEALQVGLGYDRGRFGGSLALELASPDVGERQASALSLAALAHWYPRTRVLRSWQPVVSGGYVRHALGGIDVHSDDLPDFVINTETSGAPPQMVEDVGLLGNGLRVGVGARRPLFRSGAFTLEATGDLVSFSSVSSNGYESSVPAPGVSFIPRVSLGLAIWPF